MTVHGRRYGSWVTASRPRARRRSTEQIRGLILEAARELFDEHGYDGTTTKDIADRAGVYERLVYTNFETKAGLFDAAVVEPLSLLVAEYLDGWNEHPDDTTPEQRIDRLVRGLFQFALANRDALRTVVSGLGTAGPSPGQDLPDLIARTLFSSLDVDALARDYEYLDPPAVLVAVAGMAFGVAMLDELLVPRGIRRPSHERLADQMSDIATYGVLNEPTPRRRR